MKRHLLAASALALAACTSAPPTTDTASTEAPSANAASKTRIVITSIEPGQPQAVEFEGVILPDPQPTSVMAAVSGGKHVYETFCAACHSGGDETAPELKTLHTFNRERVATALSDKGLMALQSQMINAGQREQVIGFLTASPTTLAALDAANNSADPGGLKRDAYRPEFSYPVRRVRDERDSPDGERPPAWNAPALGAGPFDFESWEQRKLHVEVVARGLTSPRALEFLPDGAILVTERAGPLRIIRDGKLDPKPIAGGPDKVAVLGTATGFMDIALHPDFKTNGLIYLSYHKPRGDLGSNAIWRGRWDGTKIVDGKDIFLSDDVDALYSRMAFGADGKLYVTIGCPGVGTDDSIGRAQNPDDFAGKTLRLNDDGTVPKDNPFVGKKGYNPEIYTIGHRVNLGLTMNPWTKEFWVSEHGPNGGDEVNILRPAQNYGWPVVSDGRYYAGPKVSGEMPVHDGMTRPHISYVPSIAPGGMVFYTGDKFPGWKRNLFLGAMRMSNSPRTGHIERIVFNENWEVVRSEMLLLDLHQRIRDVDQSPDGYLYAITDEGAESVLLKLEPGK